MHWPGWCRPERETTLPFSQATHICGRYTKILQHVTGIRTLVQESRLDDAARAEFLAQFVPDPAETLLGFGVMGGIFGEGVDLAGSRLIGCAIVGVGLLQVNPQQEMLRRYYDAQNGFGFDYAYRYPGMNKVLQAAGRVIRTPEDRGAVLLLDDRFAQQEYIRLFLLTGGISAICAAAKNWPLPCRTSGINETQTKGTAAPKTGAAVPLILFCFILLLSGSAGYPTRAFHCAAFPTWALPCRSACAEHRTLRPDTSFRTLRAWRDPKRTICPAVFLSW